MSLAVSGAGTQREGALWREVIVLAALAASVDLFRGPQLSGAWYNNLGSLALSREWPAVREAPSVPRCLLWALGPASAAPVARALRLDPLNVQLERGVWEEAVTAYQQALAWRPGETTIQQRLESAMSSRQ